MGFDHIGHKPHRPQIGRFALRFILSAFRNSQFTNDRFVPYFPILHFHVSHFQPHHERTLQRILMRFLFVINVRNNEPSEQLGQTKAPYDKTHLVYLVADMV